MKHIFSYISILSMVILSVQCSFLDEQVKTDISTDDIKDLSSLEFALNGVYSRLQNCYSSNLISIGELGTDISCTVKSDKSALPIDTYTITPSTSPCELYWRNHFLVVRDANIVMDIATGLLEDNVIEEKDGKRIIAEASALRAFAYFRLMMAFGELPVVDKRIDVIGKEEFAYPRSSINDVFHFIENDLLQAIGSETLKGKNGGRMNIWAAKGLLAKLYLYVGSSKLRNEKGSPEGAFRSDNGEPVPGGKTNLIPGYSEVEESCDELFSSALALCEDIIGNGGFSLNDNYHDSFIPDRKNSNHESIWEVQFAAVSGYGSDWSKQFGLSTGVNQQNFSCVGGKNVIKPVPGYYKYFKVGDSRRDINYSHVRIVYFDDQTIQNISDNFGSSYNSPVTNPSSGKDVTIAFSSNLENVYLPEMLEKSYLQPAMTLQSGSWKYGWGQSDNPEEWKTESMSYALSDCPNNVVVLRYADILLMYAECDMLLNGADPSNPAGAFASEKAVGYVNMIVDRALHGESPDNIESSLRAQLEDEASNQKVTYENSKADWEKTPANDAKFKTYYTNELTYRNTLYKLENLSDICLKHYTSETLTYEALVDERAKEFFGEFQRWFDLQRLGWLEYKVLQRRINWTSFPLPNIQTPKHYLYPIPLMETDLSTNEDFKKNNPGY
ncbi:MAG: RagB/SusD family nutrient uptake outer membrane protein [Candidatus Cryptobacteroides sp.]